MNGADQRADNQWLFAENVGNPESCEVYDPEQPHQPDPYHRRWNDGRSGECRTGFGLGFCFGVESGQAAYSLQ